MADEEKFSMDRRDFFRTVRDVGLTAAMGGIIAYNPQNAMANVEALIAEHLGDGPITQGKITIDAPAKAENGALVKVAITIDHPMERDHYIHDLILLVDNNPKPFIASFEFTPECGQAFVECRIKMAKTSPLRAVAKTNDGKLYGAIKKIEVIEGGCVGRPSST